MKPKMTVTVCLVMPDGEFLDGDITYTDDRFINEALYRLGLAPRKGSTPGHTVTSDRGDGITITCPETRESYGDVLMTDAGSAIGHYECPGCEEILDA